MILSFLHAVIYEPLYNGLIFFVGVVPTHDVGIAIILLTIVVRIILFPLSKRAIESQIAMKTIAPEIEALKKKYKDNNAEQGKAMFALYKERGIHPFASAGMLLLELTVLFALYYVFWKGGLPHVDASILYSFVHVPEAVNMYFLGFVDMSAAHNIILALLVALSQLFYTRLSMGKKQNDSPIEASLSADLAKSFDFQARYVMPIIIGVIAYYVVAAAALYLFAANIFMIVQEYWAGRRF